MIDDKTLFITASICFVIIFVSLIISDYKTKKNITLFRLQVLEAKACLKEKHEYERRLSLLGYEISQSEQVKTIAHFYEVLNRAAVEYDQNPKAVPSPIAAALLDISYNYTILKNE